MIIAPSVLSLDYKDTKSQLQQLEESKAEWMHFDVMDGHFVPNLSFGPDILKAFKSATSLFMDVHIMVDNPSEVSDYFIKAGADLITFHSETIHEIKNQKALVEKLHANNVKAGISIKPDTCVENIYPILPYVDLVLVMSVYPGFGGQSFIESSLDKIAKLREFIDANHLNCLIEVDGGINGTTGEACAKAGADVLVAGSYIFKGDIKRQVETLCFEK